MIRIVQQQHNMEEFCLAENEDNFRYCFIVFYHLRCENSEVLQNVGNAFEQNFIIVWKQMVSILNI
jgi:hypothetical protein